MAQEPAQGDSADADGNDVAADDVAEDVEQDDLDQHLVDETPMPQRPNGLLSPDSTAGAPLLGSLHLCIFCYLGMVEILFHVHWRMLLPLFIGKSPPVLHCFQHDLFIGRASWCTKRWYQVETINNHVAHADEGLRFHANSQ